MGTVVSSIWGNFDKSLASPPVFDLATLFPYELFSQASSKAQEVVRGRLSFYRRHVPSFAMPFFPSFYFDDLYSVYVLNNTAKPPLPSRLSHHTLPRHVCSRQATCKRLVPPVATMLA